MISSIKKTFTNNKVVFYRDNSQKQDSINNESLTSESEDYSYILDNTLNSLVEKNLGLEDMLLKFGIDFSSIQNYLNHILINYEPTYFNYHLFSRNHFLSSEFDLFRREELQKCLQSCKFIFPFEVENVLVTNNNNSVMLSFLVKQQPSQFLKYFPHLKGFFVVPQMYYFHIGNTNIKTDHFIPIKILYLSPL